MSEQAGTKSTVLWRLSLVCRCDAEIVELYNMTINYYKNVRRNNDIMYVQCIEPIIIVMDIDRETRWLYIY